MIKCAFFNEVILHVIKKYLIIFVAFFGKVGVPKKKGVVNKIKYIFK